MSTREERMAEHVAAVKQDLGRIGRLIACEQDGDELSSLLYTLVTEVAEPTMPTFRAAVAAAWKSIEDDIDEHERQHPGCFDEQDDADVPAEETAPEEPEIEREGLPVRYLHCSTCLAEHRGDVEQPADFPQEPTSPREYARLNVGVTTDGWIVLECVRHEQDVCRIHAPQMASFAAAPCCGEGHGA